MWLIVRPSHLYKTDQGAFLAHRCGRLRVSTWRLTACQEKAENGLFAGQIFRGKRCGRDVLSVVDIGEPGKEAASDKKV